MFNSRTIQGIFVIVIATFLAIWLGLSIVTDQIETIIYIIATAVFITCLALGKKIWLLFPFMIALNIQLRIPGQPNTPLIAQLLVLAFSGPIFLIRKLPFSLKLTELEFWAIVLTLCIFQVYLRNPVGLNVLGGATIGGKGYFLYVIALFSGLLLVGLNVPPEQLKLILPLSITGGLLNIFFAISGNYIPFIASYMGGSAVSSENAGFDDRVIDGKAATRSGVMAALGPYFSLWISSYMSPIKAMRHPLWAILIIVAIVAAGLSGFRNNIAMVGLTLILGIAYRSGIAGLGIAIFGCIGGLTLLAITNTLHPLPPNLQRAFSFLPGTWEERYKLDAEGSSEWRFEVWREALFTDRWIHNKWIGDGLGFSATELAGQINSREGARAGVSGFEAHRDIILSNGDYHSGPVSTVRVIGYIGLLFFLLAQIRLAVHAHRQIIRCRGTEWYPLALFIGIPLIVAPLFFVFIFGDFKTAASTFLLSIGMVRLLENNLPLPSWQKPNRSPYLLMTARKQSAISRRIERPASGDR